jgi:phosphomannomutase
MSFCSEHPPTRLLKSKLAKVKAYDGVKFIAQDGSWLMLRGSGTEPILRIYAEAKTDEDAQALLRQGVRLTRKI